METVQCYSGASYAERPASFTWQGERLEVAEILARWNTPDRRCFRVLTRDQQVFLLCYLIANDEWQIEQL